MEELVGEEGEDPQHEMQMDLGAPLHPYLPSSELVFQPGIHPLADAPLAVSSGRRRVKGGISLPRPFRAMIGR